MLCLCGDKKGGHFAKMNPVVSVVITCSVVATAFVLFMDVRQPTLQESTAFLVMTAASYALSPSLPPVLALFYCAWLLKSYPYHLRAEQFTISAPHDQKPDKGPAGEDAPIYHDGSRLAKAEVDKRRGQQALLATPDMLHVAQTNYIPAK